MDINKRVKYGKALKRGVPVWMKDTKYHMKNEVKIIKHKERKI